MQILLNNKMFKKIAIVYIIGGFGNQLFQFAFANHLKKMGFRVYVDVSEYKKNKSDITPRVLEIKPEYFQLDEVGSILKLFVTIFSKLHLYRRLNIGNRQNYLFNSQNDRTLDLDIKSCINFYNGYFQKINLLEENLDFIKKGIEQFLNKDIEGIYSKIDGSTALHVRRTDYINMNEELSLNFYRDSIEYCKKNIKNFTYSIFTDDEEFIKNEIFKDSVNIYIANSKSRNTLDDFLLLSSFENFIVGNSTFSLIAALLGEVDESLILTANPWFRNQKSPDLYKSSWITFENK